MGLKSRGGIPSSEQQFRTDGRHLMLLEVEQLIYGSLKGGRTTQTICTTVQSNLNRDTDPPGSMVAGSWSTGLGEQS